MVRMTAETCSRCTNKLASSNHHPDRICGECQHDLGSYAARRKSPLLREWLAAGRPRIVRPAEGSVVTAHVAPPPPAPLSLADIGSWPVDVLTAAARELLRRREMAAEVERATREIVSALTPPQPQHN